jgi:uncharacterized FlaG/YvyC family protein
MPDTPRTTGTAGTNRTTTATKRSTTAKKAAATRSANQAAEARKRTASAKKAAATRAEKAKKPVDRVQEYAERAVSVQIGAVLVAGDSVKEAVDGLKTTLTSREKAEKEIQLRRRRAVAGLEAEFKRFERRGSSARTRVRRDVQSLRSDLNKQVSGVTAQGRLVTARVENLVQTGVTAGQKAATSVQERIASVA